MCFYVYRFVPCSRLTFCDVFSHPQVVLIHFRQGIDTKINLRPYMFFFLIIIKTNGQATSKLPFPS